MNIVNNDKPTGKLKARWFDDLESILLGSCECLDSTFAVDMLFCNVLKRDPPAHLLGKYDDFWDKYEGAFLESIEGNIELCEGCGWWCEAYEFSNENGECDDCNS